MITHQKKWLIQSLSVKDVVERSRQLQSRILLDDVPSGNEMLTEMIEAMEENKVVKMIYRRFNDTIPLSPIFAEPYCVKVNNRRWYALCHVSNQHVPDNTSVEYKKFGCLKIYALDRIRQLTITDEKFTFPDDFNPKEFFANYFGVYIDYEIPIQKILIRIDGWQRQYLRTLPLHHSQLELKTYDDHSIFEYHLHPTMDFISAILSFGAAAEVIEPLELRKMIADECMIMNTFYHK
jgi:hypothetical protein